MRVKKTRDVKTPERGSSQSAGLDFFIPNDMEWETKTLNPNESISIPSGIICEVPKQCMLLVLNKSGQALKKGLQVGACVIDEDYQGEIHLHVTNVSKKPAIIRRGEKLVQMVVVPVLYESVEVSDVVHENKSERGDGGFGSTGLQ